MFPIEKLNSFDFIETKFNYILILAKEKKSFLVLKIDITTDLNLLEVSKLSYNQMNCLLLNKNITHKNYISYKLNYSNWNSAGFIQQYPDNILYKLIETPSIVKFIYKLPTIQDKTHYIEFIYNKKNKIWTIENLYGNKNIDSKIIFKNKINRCQTTSDISKLLLKFEILTQMNSSKEFNTIYYYPYKINTIVYFYNENKIKKGKIIQVNINASEVITATNVGQVINILYLIKIEDKVEYIGSEFVNNSLYSLINHLNLDVNKLK